ncbi:MAG: hypothetical protein ACLUEQ_12360 [Cloacibacillus evryensis]
MTSGVSFLRSVKTGGGCDLRGKEVIVIGGGNVSMDCARTAIRLGAAKVSLFCLEKEDEMLAHPDEVREVKMRGFTYSTAGARWRSPRKRDAPTG